MTEQHSAVDWSSLEPGVFLVGLDASSPVEVVASSQVASTNSYNVVYRRADGSTGIFVADGSTRDIRILERSRRWTFDADPALFRLVTEAQRIRFAYLFDPLLAVHTSIVEPLPHQITAVYQEMLTRQPLRYLLADDPGAGKTIMTGLFIRELIARGDLQRCLIVAPGALVEQWQDELHDKFHLRFAILTSDQLEAAGAAWFEEHPLAIARLDKLSRDDSLRERLAHLTPWDLIVIDEAHKMSATLFGSEVKRTKRYQLGQLLVGLARHVLLLTATPHNGKESDFQLFLSLLDPDRFEGKYRDEHGHLDHRDVGDLMRRLVKEDLRKFDGERLFPPRYASTVGFELSPLERKLYDEVTAYVRDQFNRAERLDDDRRRGNVGFALTVLQRRLASSTAAIAASLERRRERLEKRLNELEQAHPAPETSFDTDYLDDIDDLPEDEAEEIVDQVVDEATAARTAEELRAEITILKQLEELAQRVRRDPDSDRKWRELAKILGDADLMTDRHGQRRKFIIFTEHRDTLEYLCRRLRSLRGRPDAIVSIHGGLHRDARKAAETAFKNDPNVEILVATDAAGEGINLQRAHLMANYDLPWNPNRIEQRFGRIHRIGQKEDCHLWNLIALDTREGDVFAKLFEKIERQREVLGDGVFDILGTFFRNQPLRDLLVDAIRSGENPKAKERFNERLDMLLDVERARELMRERALAADMMDLGIIREVRADMERAEARRLQPHFIRAFFLEAFRCLGGSFRRADGGRYELTHVPSDLRAHARALSGAVLPRRYERVAFEKDQREGPPPAEFLCPGHPLLDAVVDLTLKKFGYATQEGAALVDPADQGCEPRTLVIFESTVQDGRTLRFGGNEVVSRELHFVELTEDGTARVAGYAPHLDYRPPTDEERSRLSMLLGDWRKTDAEHRAQAYALEHMLPRQQVEVEKRMRDRVTRARAAVRERLTREIIFHEGRAAQLQADERAGKQIRLNWQREETWADELRERLKRRMDDLGNQERLTALPPRLLGCAKIIPAGLFAPPSTQVDPAARAAIEQIAMQATIDAERALGHVPRDVSADNLGYDIESALPDSTKVGQKLRFIEVKGRIAEAPVVTVTKKEILTALNMPDDFILSLVAVGLEDPPRPKYLRKPFSKEPDFGATSVNYDFDDLLRRAGDPC